MPRSPVVNRRNVSDLTQHSLSASPDAVAELKRYAARLHVSQGSMVDTALREFLLRPAEEVIEALAHYGHLDPKERAVVEDLLAAAESKTDRSTKSPSTGRRK